MSKLQVAWTFPTGDNNKYFFNPVVVDGTMYVLARSNSIVALHHKKLYVIGFLRVIMYADNRPRSKTQHVVCQLIPCEARISLQLIG